MVEAPGTAPGSEWFIAAAIYRHSRQAGRPNIGAKRPRRKSGRAVLQNCGWFDRACADPPLSSRLTRVSRLTVVAAAALSHRRELRWCVGAGVLLPFAQGPT